LELSLGDIVKKVGGELFGPPETLISGIAPIDVANHNQITFYTRLEFLDKVGDCKAAAIITGKKLEQANVPQLIHDEPYVAMAKVSQLFNIWEHSRSGQSEHVFVHEAAEVDKSVTLYPNVYIDSGATIKSGCTIYPYTYIGRNVILSENGTIFPNVTIYDETEIGKNATIHSGCVIGSDGFGFAPGKEGNIKIPQIGKVILGDDVEIQSNSVIARGTLENTILGDGCKLDAHVLIAHGVQIGKHALLCGHASIAGSAKVGDRLTMAGQTAVAPGITVGDGITLGGKAGLTGSLDKPGVYHGMPVSKTSEWRKQMVSLRRLPDLIKTVRVLEEKIKQLESKSN